MLGLLEMERMKSPQTFKPVYIIAIASFMIFLMQIGWKSINDSAWSNLHAHQANALLRGQLDIPAKLHDVSIHNGKYYVPFPPLPAIILMPFVALFGVVKTKVILVALLLTFLNAWTFSRILKRLEVDQESILWLMLAFFLGTGYWLAVKASQGVCYFSHIVAITFMLLAIHEALGNGRGIIAGMFLGCAFLSRQLTIFSSLFILSALMINRYNISKGMRARHIAGFGLSLCLCITVYAAFNWARFGSLFDTGYSYLHLGGFLKPRFERFGLFSPAYFFFNFIYMFFQGPHIEFSGLRPIGMSALGTSLVFASPFVLFAFWAKWNRVLIFTSWCSIGLTLLPMLFYYNNGWGQWNAQRFTMDFLPVLILLVAMSVHQVNKNIFRISIVYSVFLNVIALIALPIVNTLVSLFER